MPTQPFTKREQMQGRVRASRPAPTQQTVIKSRPATPEQLQREEQIARARPRLKPSPMPFDQRKAREHALELELKHSNMRNGELEQKLRTAEARGLELADELGTQIAKVAALELAAEDAAKLVTRIRELETLAASAPAELPPDLDLPLPDGDEHEDDAGDDAPESGTHATTKKKKKKGH